MLSLEGQQLGNYDVIRRIRVGGMGAVYEGRQRTAFDRRVAIKVILGNYAADKEMRRRFAREARTIARLHHPHILPLIEFGDERGILYLVMPFIEGGTLTGYLRRTLPGLEDVAIVYQQLLDAVEYAHEEGLIHRDIKSSNILLEQNRSGQPPYIYLADFGLVRTVYQADPEQVGKPIPLDQVPGTPHYMAPEQTFGIITPLTDIYALGVLLYQMLTGELPYNDPDDIRVIQKHLQDPVPLPSKHDASIPVELDAVVGRALAKKPEERYQTVDELRCAFLEAVKGPDPLKGITAPVLPVVAPPDPSIVEESLPFKRHTPTPLTLHEPSREAARLPQLSGKQITPFLMPHRSHKDATVPLAVHSPHSKLARQKERLITADQGKGGAKTGKIGISDVMTRKQGLNHQLEKKHPRLFRWLTIALSVLLLLLLVLTLPRVLGWHIPYLNDLPVAMVYITPKTRSLQNTFVLTAAPGVNAPDVVTHTIPDNQLQAHVGNSVSVQTTGSRLVGGAQAHGLLTLINASNQAVALPSGYILATSAGTRLQLLQNVTIPPHLNGQDGKISVQVQVADPGAAGNLVAHSTDGPCCGTGVSIRNVTPFSGGVDGQLVHTLSQTDLDSARDSLVPRLEQQVEQQIKQQLQTNDVLAAPISFSVGVSADSPVNARVDHATVSVSVVGIGLSYNSNQAIQMAVELLNKQAVTLLDSNYQAQSTVTPLTQPAVVVGKHGGLYVSVQVGGVWIYQYSKQQIGQWTQSIRGATAVAANAYLMQQPGIANVQVSLPFGTDRLPTSYNQIKIVLVKPGG